MEITNVIEFVNANLPFFIIGFIIFDFIFILILLNYLDKKRTGQLKDLADGKGLLFEEDAERLMQEIESKRIPLHFFEKGSCRQAANCSYGVHAGKAYADFFDYSYVTGSGKSRSTHVYRCGLVRFPGEVSLPQFELVPENFVMRLVDKVLSRDIDFDNYPFFSEKYQLTAYSDITDSQQYKQINERILSSLSGNEEYVRKLFQPSVISCLENHTGLEAYSKANFLLVCKAGSMKIEKIEEFEISVREISEIIYSSYQSNSEYFRSMQA